MTDLRSHQKCRSEFTLVRLQISGRLFENRPQCKAFVSFSHMDTVPHQPWGFLSDCHHELRPCCIFFHRNPCETDVDHSDTQCAAILRRTQGQGVGQLRNKLHELRRGLRSLTVSVNLQSW